MQVTPYYQKYKTSNCNHSQMGKMILQQSLHCGIIIHRFPPNHITVASWAAMPKNFSSWYSLPLLKLNSLLSSLVTSKPFRGFYTTYFSPLELKLGFEVLQKFAFSHLLLVPMFSVPLTCELVEAACKPLNALAFPPCQHWPP